MKMKTKKTANLVKNTPVWLEKAPGVLVFAADKYPSWGEVGSLGYSVKSNKLTSQDKGKKFQHCFVVVVLLNCLNGRAGGGGGGAKIEGFGYAT